jgi:hypothetical protein
MEVWLWWWSGINFNASSGAWRSSTHSTIHTATMEVEQPVAETQAMSSKLYSLGCLIQLM